MFLVQTANPFNNSPGYTIEEGEAFLNLLLNKKLTFSIALPSCRIVIQSLKDLKSGEYKFEQLIKCFAWLLNKLQKPPENYFDKNIPEFISHSLSLLNILKKKPNFDIEKIGNIENNLNNLLLELANLLNSKPFTETLDFIKAILESLPSSLIVIEKAVFNIKIQRQWINVLISKDQDYLIRMVAIHQLIHSSLGLLQKGSRKYDFLIKLTKLYPLNIQELAQNLVDNLFPHHDPIFMDLTSLISVVIEILKLIRKEPSDEEKNEQKELSQWINLGLRSRTEPFWSLKCKRLIQQAIQLTSLLSYLEYNASILKNHVQQQQIDQLINCVTNVFNEEEKPLLNNLTSYPLDQLNRYLQHCDNIELIGVINDMMLHPLVNNNDYLAKFTQTLLPFQTVYNNNKQNTAVLQTSALNAKE